MTDENKALIGRECYVEFEGKRHRAEIVDVVETIKNSNEIILYCLNLTPRRYRRSHYDLGSAKVELI